jgi:hypothetical protein
MIPLASNKDWSLLKLRMLEGSRINLYPVGRFEAQTQILYAR